jgi:uncharacterized protein (DUF58 family)
VPDVAVGSHRKEQVVARQPVGNDAADPQPRDDRRYLDPHVLAAISGLQLRARLAVAGLYAGMHRSPYRGVSVEFADHRPYTQSDDIKHIDWKLFGRTDRYFVKEYEQDTNLNCVLAVDGSESMAFRSDAAPLAKYDYAAALAACVAYLALKQQDSVGLALFDDHVRRWIKPTNHPSQWRPLLDELDRGTGPAKTSLGTVLHDLADRVQRGLVVLLSDLFDETDDVVRGLEHLRYRGNDLIVIQVWDPAELRFPYRGPTKFDGLEAAGELATDADTLRDHYLAEVARVQATLDRTCRGMQADYVVCDTSASLAHALSAYLSTRSGRVRGSAPREGRSA